MLAGTASSSWRHSQALWGIRQRHFLLPRDIIRPPSLTTHALTHPNLAPLAVEACGVRDTEPGDVSITAVHTPIHHGVSGVWWSCCTGGGRQLGTVLSGPPQLRPSTTCCMPSSCYIAVALPSSPHTPTTLATCSTTATLALRTLPPTPQTQRHILSNGSTLSPTQCLAHPPTHPPPSDHLAQDLNTAGRGAHPRGTHPPSHPPSYHLAPNPAGFGTTSPPKAARPPPRPSPP